MMETVKQFLRDLMDFEEHEMPWPLMVLAGFILLMIAATVAS